MSHDYFFLRKNPYFSRLEEIHEDLGFLTTDLWKFKALSFKDTGRNYSTELAEPLFYGFQVCFKT